MAGKGMIHGRFQPFHLGHLEYLRGAAEQFAPDHESLTEKLLKRS